LREAPDSRRTKSQIANRSHRRRSGAGTISRSDDATGQIPDTFINGGKKTLKNAMALARRQGINAECVLHEKLLGSLSDLILEEAKEWKSDIIVLGTHANTGIKHLLLGSNAEDIARSSRIPVLIVHSATKSA
jgi:nucleotide-binding universal stress UspA family protein